MLTTACSSRGNRPRLKVSSCPELLSQVRFRDQFFEALRGRARTQGLGISSEIELALFRPDKARLEFAGPLGVRLGLLVLNDEWLQLYIPRENTVFRFPTSELKQDTLRRERFLKLLPLPLAPEVFVESLLTRVSLPAALPDSACNLQDLRLRIPSTEGSGRFVWLDPRSFAPSRVLYFERNLPLEPSEAIRPVYEIRYRRPRGEGPATLPTQIELWRGGKRELLFDWEEAEAWQSPRPEIFEYRPAASAVVKDY